MCGRRGAGGQAAAMMAPVDAFKEKQALARTMDSKQGAVSAMNHPTAPRLLSEAIDFEAEPRGLTGERDGETAKVERMLAYNERAQAAMMSESNDQYGRFMYLKSSVCRAEGQSFEGWAALPRFERV